MAQIVKNKKDIIALAVAVSVSLCLILVGGLWLLFSSPENIVFIMPGGDNIDVEYGEEFRHDVSARAILPFFGTELYLEARCDQLPDMQLPGSYRLTYKARFLGRTAVAERIVNVVDTKPPEIILSHSEGYSPDWSEGYREEGYLAVDARDGDLTDKVRVEHSDGCIIYSVRDSSGNECSVRREINYKNRPEIILNGGDQVISPRPFYSDPGACAIDPLGNDYTQLITVSGMVDSRRPGEYELLYSIQNPGGDTVSASRRVRVDYERKEEQPGEGRVIYLTFDDGPGPYTDMLLDVLDAYNVKATFFVTGNGERYNDCITRAHEAGHSIGVHTYGHNYGYIYSSEENFFNDFNAIQQLIYDRTGQYSSICRFPGGSSNTVSCFNHGIMSRLSAELDAMGYRYFDWNVNSRDAEGATRSEDIAANIIYGCAGRSCSVVLQHDIKAGSVYAVERVIQWGLDNGYTFKALTSSSPVVCQQIVN